MKRRRTGLDPVPKRLRTFTPSQWGSSRVEALRAWIDARKQYWQQHPNAWPDFISMMAGPANVRAKSLGRRPPYPREDEGQE